MWLTVSANRVAVKKRGSVALGQQLRSDDFSDDGRGLCFDSGLDLIRDHGVQINGSVVGGNADDQRVPSFSFNHFLIATITPPARDRMHGDEI